MNKKFILFFVFLFSLSLVSFSAAYLRSNPAYTSSYAYNSGGFFGTGDHFDNRMCKAGQDFILQIDPTGCIPPVVRSDLLEDQDVYVMCPIVATQINPLIDIKAVKNILLKGDDLSNEVADIGFHPARSSLGYKNEIKSPVMENLGYAVIELRRQPSEKDMPDFVEGNLSARIIYDIDNAFGVGRATFYLNPVSNKEWDKEYLKGSFWNGRGYLRAESVGNNQATISVYSGNTLTTPKNSYKEKLTTTTLDEGEESPETIYLPTFDYCMGGMQVRLDGVENVDEYAKIMVNANELDLKKGQQFLNKRCAVKDFNKDGLNQEVELRCSEDDSGFFSSTDFTLRIVPRINLTVDGKTKSYTLGDRIYEGDSFKGRKSIYLVYAYLKGESSDAKDLVTVFVASPETKDHLSDEDLSHWKNFIERYRTDKGDINILEALKYLAISPGAFGETVMNSIVDGNIPYFIGYGKEDKISVNSLFTQGLNSADSFASKILYYSTLSLLDLRHPSEGDSISIKVDGFSGATDLSIKDLEQDYSKALADFNNVIDNYGDLKESEKFDLYSQRALLEKIKLAKNVGKMKTMQEFCEEFSKQFPNVPLDSSLGCSDEMELSNSALSSRTVLIDNELKEISFKGIYEPSFEDYNAQFQITMKDGSSQLVSLGKDDQFYFGGSSENLQNYFDSDSFVTSKSLNKKQREDVDPLITQLVNCMDSNYYSSKKTHLVVTSFTDNNLYNGKCDLNDDSESYTDSSNCVHKKTSCHYARQGDVLKSRAVDLSVSGFDKSAIKSAYESCKAIFSGRDSSFCSDFVDESDPPHIHIEADCGCGAYSKDKKYSSYPEETLLSSSNYNEYLQLVSLNDGSAKIIGNIGNRGFLSEQFTDNVWDLDLDEPRQVGDYVVTLKKVNLKKVAKVSIIPRIDYTESNATFKFKIGIEKRAIQLAPEKIKKKIDNLGKSIEKWQKLSDGLNKTVKAMKTACIGAEAGLTAVNLVKNAGGKGIARQKVMNMEGGWYDKCREMANNGEYPSLDKCLLDNSDNIDTEVNLFAGILEKQNTEIKEIQSSHKIVDKKLGQDIIDTDGFIKDYSKVVQGSFDESIINSIDDKNKLNYNDVQKDISYSAWSEGKYNIDDLKNIELYSDILKTDPNNEIAKNGLYSVLLDVQTNAGNFAEVSSLQDSLNNAGFDKLKVHSYGSKGSIEGEYTGQTIVGTNLVGSDLDSQSYPMEIVTYNNKKYVLILDGANGHYFIREDGVYDYLGVSGNKINVKPSEDDYLIRSAFKGFRSYDKSSYENEFKSSLGENKPVVRYFEVEPYKGLPAIVPFDLKNGWYVASKASLPIGAKVASYDKSGRVNSFYLCNVGENHVEEFDKGMGDDICQMINLAIGTTYTQFSGLSSEEISSLVSNGVNAIQQVSEQYPAKSGKVKVSTSRGTYILKVGSPAVEVPDIQCQDFMSPKECNVIFNLCDPVICPSSRCDFGGAYPVRDVIQSGIVGSILLCAPNYREGIYAPVCLTGVKAGVDNWLTVKKSYKDCLQQSLDTGETVGICDEINSVYMCDFFWRQAMPLAKVALPNLVNLAIGQKTRGGGEYLTFQNAWQSAGKSLKYFTQTYAENAYAAFKARSSEEAIGKDICKVYSSISITNPSALLDSMTEPDSPAQFSGRFDETPFNTAVNPPISHYKVAYHIFAGNDRGAYYRVYLKPNNVGSFYQDTSQIRIVDSGYIPKGEYNTDTKDFTAPSGYSTLCIMVNGQEECDFKEVSTSFAVNYVQDEYVSQQANQTSITSESECISGSASLYNLLNPNAQGAAESAINPAIYNRGIIRICATDNPGVSSDPGAGGQESRWVDVGYCDNPKLRCWLDRDSVKDSIEFANIKNDTLESLQDKWNEALLKSGKCTDNFYGELENITNNTKFSEKDSLDVKISKLRERISLTTDLLERACFNKEKAKGYFERGKDYALIVKLIYVDYLAHQTKPEEKPSSEPVTGSICSDEGGKCADSTAYDCSVDWESGKCPGSSSNLCCKGDLNNKPNAIENKLNYPIIVYNPGVFTPSTNLYFDKDKDEWKVCSGKLLGLSTSNRGCSDLNSKDWVFASKVDSLGTAPSKDIFDLGNKLDGKDYFVGFRYSMRFAKDNDAKLYSKGNSLYVEFDPSTEFITLKKDGNKIFVKYDEKNKLGWEWKSSSSSDRIEGIDTWNIITSTGIIKSNFCGMKGSTPSAQKKFDKECKRENKEVSPFKDVIVGLNGKLSLSSGLDFLFRKAGYSLISEASDALDSFLASSYEKDALKSAEKCSDCSNWLGLRCTIELCSAIKVKTGLNCVPRESEYLGKVICEEKKGDSLGVSSADLSQKFLNAYKDYDSLFKKYARLNLPQGWSEVQFRALLVAISTQETGLGTAEDKCGLHSDESCEDWLMGYTSGAKYPSSYKGAEKQISLASSLLKKALEGTSSSYRCGMVSPNDEKSLSCVLQTYGPSSTSYPVKIISFWKAWEKKLS